MYVKKRFSGGTFQPSQLSNPMKYTIPLADKDERECISKAQAGDKNSFGRLVEKYKGVLAGYCIGKLGCNFDTVEDIAQEAFLKAWKSISTFKGDSKFSSWLCTIARNHYFNMCKDRDNKTEEFDDAAQHSKGVLADNIATRDCVERQLGKVRAEYRNVIDLVHLRDMSYEDAAQTLGLPVGTLRSRLNRAFKEAGPLLKECL